MQELGASDLETLSLGATLLGSGGGGDPAILYALLHYWLEKTGPIRILQSEALPPQALVIPLALIGAPLISLERLPNSTMFMQLLAALEDSYPGRDLVLMPAEIGGCNALTPLMLAAQTALPVLDADLIGRAFPKLHMAKPAVNGKNHQISFMASPFGAVERFETHSLACLEAQARELAVHYGGSALIASFLFSGEEQADYIIPGSLRRALNWGQLLQLHSQDRRGFALATQARRLGAGLLTEVRHTLEDGFLTGYAELQMPAGSLRVYFQNEYLLVSQREGGQERSLAASPELITLIETRSGLPLTSESLRYGLKVEIFSLPAPDFWMEPRAYAQVNLAAFGLDKCIGDVNVYIRH